MEKEPEIVKILRQEEINSIQNNMDQLETINPSEETFPETTLGFVDGEFDQEIKDKKSFEKAVSFTEKQYKHLIENLPDSILTVNTKGIITSFNKATEKITGYSKSEVIGKNFTKLKLFKRKEMPRLIKLLASIKMGKEIEAFEIEFIHKNGSLCWSETHVSKIEENGKTIGFIAVSRDITELKKSEEIIKKSKKETEDILNAAADGIRLINKNFEVLNLNKKMANLAGISIKDGVGMHCYEMFKSEEVCHTDQCSMKRVLKTGEGFQEHDIRKGRDGKEATYLVDVTPYKDQNGNIIGVIEDYRDISEIKNAEKKIEYQASLLESVSDAVVSYDIHFNIKSWNKSAEKMFGWKADEIIGRKVSTLGEISYPNGEKKEEILKDLSKSGYWQGEVIRQKKDKTKVHLLTSISLLKNENGEATGAVAINRDITEQKKAENELKLKDHAIESSINSIAITNSVGNISYINPSFLKMWGYDNKEEVIGYPIVKFWQMKGTYMKVMDSMVNHGGWIGELIAERKDKTSFPVQLSANLIKDENDEIKFMMTSFVDITEQKKAEENLKQSKEKIEQQNIKLKKLDELKSAFLNITSHELRTPMSSIKGYVQMMQSKTLGEITDEQEKSLDVIIRNVNRLDHLIQDILDISRLESGTMKFIPDKTNIGKMIEEIKETMRSSADLKQITINTNIDEKIPELIIDQDRVKQVIINFLNNAIKFSPNGSDININTKVDQENILIEVKDFGRGIPKDKQKKVFETFYQVDGGMDRKFGGAGLGLAISRGIVIAHGGKIWVESEGIPDKGSSFKFSLPLKPVEDLETRFKDVDVFKIDKEVKFE